MYILAIETTGQRLSAAIITENEDVIELRAEEGMNHLQNLTPMIKELTETCQVELSEAAAIAASVGPGSFTGIRIGVSTARALSQVLDSKTISVPTLMSFAYHLPEYKGVICPIFDARRSQVYAGAYMWKMNSFENVTASEKIGELVKGAAYDLDEYLNALDESLKANEKDEIVLFGDGVKAYGKTIAQWAKEKGYTFYDARVLEENEEVSPLMKPAASIQTASSVAKLAMDFYKEGRLLEYGQLEPDYMRKAEAERKLEEAQKVQKI